MKITVNIDLFANYTVLQGGQCLLTNVEISIMIRNNSID